MDIMTGFTGKRPPDLDLGLKGNGYFEKWTTLSLPDTGKNSSVDDEQQPTGSGAPETVIPGAPLKVPMEADDVERPKIREGREAARRAQASILRRVASEIRKLDPVTARRLMAAADEISYDALSTAALPEAGDETNEVDDYQDNFGHGTLQFFGTDPAKSTSLMRESSRRVANEGSYSPCEVSYRMPGKNWEKKVCKTKSEYDSLMKDLKEDGAETKVRYLDRGEVDSKLEYASRGASRRSAAEGKGVKDVDWSNTLKLVDSAMQGKYDAAAVATILKSDYDRTMALLKHHHGSGTAASPASGVQSHQMTASWKRRARTQGDPSLHPEPTVGDQDGPGAEGAGGFVDRAKAPLQETMTADDVERPKIRENPEASRLASLWNQFRTELVRVASGGGQWNGGRWAIEARDYGDSVEIQASVVDRENMAMPVGSMLFSKLHDSPRGRYATVEVNDGILENRTAEFTLQRPRQASRVVERLVGGIKQTVKDVLDGVTV
jgi:hypothetical protein